MPLQNALFYFAKPTKANVDEVFIDLCRQIIRRDNTTIPRDAEEEIRYDYENDSRPIQVPVQRERRPHKYKRRRRKESKCIIL